jgi:WD40 repeat protein
MKNPALANPSNPFPGLRPFREYEEHLFFGRENQVDMMIDKLARTRFLAVVGTSGSGKSSLVNCGLRPALHRGLMAGAGTSWRMAQFRPGGDPLRALARALAADGVLFHDFQGGGLPLEDIIEASLRMSKLGLADVYEQAQLGEGVNLLVIADQFEELFRYRSLEQHPSVDGARDRSQEAKAFVSLLLEAAAQAGLPIYVVLTMRSDFLGDCAEFAGLPEALNQGQYLVPRLTRDERRAAIAGPVGVGGGKISPVLLTRLVNDVGDNPDQLSILQHALNRTWARWQNEGAGTGPLELPHYEAIGTMARALDQHAEKAYLELQEGRQKEICEKVFKALTDKGTDARGIRRPMELSALCAAVGAEPAEVTQVIDAFRKPSRSFLMPPLNEPLEAATVIDISHESLMRVWERLKAWTNEEARSARLYRRLSETAALHAAGKAGLWRDPDLQVALDWREREKPAKAWAELYGGGFEDAMNFLGQSEAQRQAEVREREEQQRQQLAAKRLRWLALGSFLVVLIFAGLGLYAWGQRNRALRASTAAESEREKAETQRQVAEKAAAEAGEAKDAAKDAESRAEKEKDRAEKARQEAESLRMRAEDEGSRDLEKKNQADSLRFAELAKDNVVTDPERGVLLARQAALATLPHGYLMPEAEEVLRQALHALPSRIEDSPPGLPLAVAFDADGKLAATSTRGTAMWDVESERVVNKLDLPARASHIVASANGKYVAAVTDVATTVHLWDLSTGEDRELKDPAAKDPAAKDAAAITSIVFSRDGSHLAAASGGGITVWSVRGDGTPPSIQPLAGAAFTTLALSANGRYLAAAINDPPPNNSATVQIWDTTNHDIQPQGTQVTGRVSKIEMSDDGQLVALASGLVITTWERSTGTQKTEQKRSLASGGGTILSLSPDGCRLVTANSTGAARLWLIPRSGGTQCAQVLQQRDVQNVRLAAFSPDSKLVATASSDRRVTVLDSTSGTVLFVTPDNRGEIEKLTFSPDGRLLATASSDRKIRVWNALPGDGPVELAGHKDTIYRVAFGPGSRVATASWDKTAIVWDASSGRSLQPLHGHTAEVMGVAFSPDGRLIATASVDGTAKIWDSDSGKETLRLTGHTDRVMAVAFSPDGKHLATASWDKTARIWDAHTGRALRTLTGHSGHVEHVAFSPDGKWLATASSDRSAKIWDALTGREKLTLTGHKSDVVGVAFDPYESRLATASADGTAIIWNASSGKPIRTLSGHIGTVRSVAFSPDGKLLATVSEDGTAVLWKSDSDVQIGTLSRNTDKAYGIAFSPDGSHVAISRAGGRAFVYPTNAKALMDVAQERVTRSLTAGECIDYSVKSEQCNTNIKADRLVQEARDAARAGDFAHAEADFKTAEGLNPDLKLDRQEPARLAATHWLLDGREKASKDDVDGAIADFRKALNLYPNLKELDANPAWPLVAKGISLIRLNKLKDGAEEISKAVSVYTAVKELDPSGRLRAEAWNDLCWNGSLEGHAAEVIDKCERAVELERDDPDIRDSRGLARALSGDVKDVSGAIEDFQFFAAKSPNADRKRQRQGWIDALNQGQNPFTPELIKQLFNQ